MDNIPVPVNEKIRGTNCDRGVFKPNSCISPDGADPKTPDRHVESQMAVSSKTRKPGSTLPLRVRDQSDELMSRGIFMYLVSQVSLL